ncbi:MAG: SIS domain-containing protein [Elusimicrobiales bacterium]|nr:SIS domain-containing protein [Elusimicrobiales bacterium]
MKQTLTYKDISDIPKLLVEFDEKNKSFYNIDKYDEFFLLGRGSSGNATLFAKYIWESYCGKISNIVHPFSVFNLKKKFNMKGRILFAFSQSGRSYDIVECSKRFKEMGAKIIAITNEKDLNKNSLAKISSYHVLLSKYVELPVAATKSFILQLWAILRISQFLGSGFREKQFRKTIKEISGVIDKFEFYYKSIDFNLFLKSRVVGFVGRGPFNAIAEDAALKFREMAQIQSLGFSAAEFLHGPVGAFGNDDLVVILSRGLKLTKDLKLVEDKLKEKKVKYFILNPFSNNYPFNSLSVDVFIKLIALKLATLKGLNPDCPHGLTKVTYTF